MLLQPWRLYAACGLAISLAAHVLSLAGLQPGGRALFFALQFAALILILPMSRIWSTLGGRMRADGNSAAAGEDAWNILLSASPAWLKQASFGLFLYAFFNMAIFLIRFAISGEATLESADGGPGALLWQGFSGHWMFFYCIALASFDSAMRRAIRI